MSLTLQMTGSLLVLAAFVAAQRTWLSHRSRRYLAVNFLGSAILAGDAVWERQWGFVLLEGVWALFSLVVLVEVLMGQRRAPGER